MQIEMKNVTKEFSLKKKVTGKFFKETQQFVAVDNLSLNVEEGEIVGLIGPNGAGKSTTIKMLTGIITPTSGKIKVCGKDPFIDKKELPYLFGSMFGQKSQLYMHLTIRDSFYLLGSIYNINPRDLEKRIHEISDMFEIEKYLAATVRKLSLGQRMICEIAACILHKPKLLYLDEPTIGLDVIAKNKVRKIIKKLNEQGTTVILTSHDVSDIESLCKRIIVINHGKIIEDGMIEDIFNKFLSKKTIDFVFSSEIRKDMLKYDFTLVNDQEVKVNVDTSKEHVGEIISYYSSIGNISDINIKTVSMEKIIEKVYKK